MCVKSIAELPVYYEGHPLPCKPACQLKIREKALEVLQKQGLVIKSYSISNITHTSLTITYNTAANPSIKGTIEITDATFTQFVELINGLQVSDAKKLYDQLQKKCLKGPKVGADKVEAGQAILPHSDKIAVIRNIAKMQIYIVAILCIGLAMAGTSPWILALIGVGICIAMLSIYIGLYKKGYITRADLIKLSIITLSCVFGGLFGGSAVLLGLYCGAVVLQGILFVLPQGKDAWFRDGKNKLNLAHEVREKFHRTHLERFLMNSGIWSGIEGATWIAMGAATILEIVCSHFLPGIGALADPAINTFCSVVVPILDKYVLPAISTALYLGIFNISFACMAISGIMDYVHQSRFHTSLTNEFKKGESPADNCKNALQFLRRKMIGLHSLVLDPEDRKLERKLHRMRKCLDAEAFALLDLERIDDLLERLEKNEANAVNLSQLMINDIIASNERNQNVAKWQFRIGLMALFIGSAFSIAEEFTTSTSILKSAGFPTMDQVSNIPGPEQDMIGLAIAAVECGGWALGNYGYKRFLDAPAGRSIDQIINYNILAKEYHLSFIQPSFDSIDEIIDYNVKAKKNSLTLIQPSFNSIDKLIKYNVKARESLLPPAQPSIRQITGYNIRAPNFNLPIMPPPKEEKENPSIDPQNDERKFWQIAVDGINYADRKLEEIFDSNPEESPIPDSSGIPSFRFVGM